MLRNIRKNYGFTLVELLVAVAIIGIIGVISTQLLWDTVTTHSKQGSIEVSSENIRTLIKNLTNYIQEANFIDIPDSSTIEIKGKVCRTIRFNAVNENIEEADNSSEGCIPPDASATYTSIIEEGINITSFVFSPLGPQPTIVTLTISGNYKDSLGEHPIDFNTTITPRITI